MTDDRVNHILCAVRGVPQSRQTVSRAIDLALENEAKLTFLHVVDVEFLEHATVGPVSIVYNELVEMAKFAMMILCDRARRRGVREAEYALREGDIREELLRAAVETHAQLMVIGHPSRRPGRSQFGDDELVTLMADLEKKGDIKVLQVGPSQA
jgi:nucleotide-binding universal stress UspA family protein